MAVRIFEKMFAILNILFVFYYIFTFTEGASMAPSTMSYLVLFCILFFLNYRLEGMKIQSLIYMIAHPMLIYGDLAEDDQTKGMSIGFFIAVCITAMTLVLFFGDSYNVPIKGRYDSGYRDVMIGDKSGDRAIRLSVFYPITKKNGWFSSGKDKANKPYWAPDGENTVKGMFNNAKFSSNIFKFLKYTEMDCDRDAEIDDDFRGKKIPVMIFSHGIRGHRNIASGLCREFASQGFVVYSIDHNDGSGASSFDEMTNQTSYYHQEDMTDLNLWKERIEERFEEIKDVLSYMHSKPTDLHSEVQLDLDKVVVVGHGFGGCTALVAAQREQRRISHVVMLDPWLFVLYKEILENYYAIPQIMCCINSEEYHPMVEGFDSWETVQALFHNNNAQEDLNVMISKTGHLFQTDVLSLAPLEFKMWSERNPSVEVVEMYELGNKVVMKWLKDYGFPELIISPHTKIDEYFEKSYVKILNKPSEPSTGESSLNDQDFEENEGEEEKKN